MRERSLLHRCAFLFLITLFFPLIFNGFDLWAENFRKNSVVDVESIARDMTARFPESDAVILYDSLAVSLDEDGLLTRRRHRKVLLLTDDAIRRYGDPRILFDSENQALEVSVARVYMRDGTKVDTGDNGMNLTTPSSVSSAPDYTSWQEMVVTHVGIEKGCIAELCYSIKDKKKVSMLLSGCFVFNEDDPVLERTLMISVPAGTRLRTSEFNGAPEPEVSRDGTLYVWRMTNLGCRKGGKGYAWYGDYLPIVCYSVWSDWELVASKVAARFGEAVKECSFADELPGMEKTGAEDVDRVRYLQKRTIGALRGVAAPFGLLSGAPRAADRVYDSGYADALDRAVVLGAILNEEGFRPYPVLVTRGTLFPEDVPVADIFDRILVAVPLGDGVVLLDPEEESGRDPSILYYGRKLLHCTVPLRVDTCGGFQAASNGSELNMDVSFEGMDLVGEGFVRMGGIFSPYWIVKGTDGELRKYLTDELTSLFGEAELVEWNVDKLDVGDVKIGFSFKVSSFLDNESGRTYMTLPLPFDSFLSGIKDADLSVSRSKAPLRVVPSRLGVDIQMTPPEGWVLSHVPEGVDIENDLGKLNVSVSIGSVMRFLAELELVKDMVPAELYPEYRRMVLSFTDSRVVLKRI